MEKFFNKSFGVCKFVSFGALILMVLAMILSIILAIYSFKPVSMETPNFNKLIKQFEQEEGVKPYNHSNKSNKPAKVPAYMKVINEISEEFNLTNYGKQWITSLTKNAEDSLHYAKGLRKFLKDAKKYAEKKGELNYFSNVISEAIETYDDYYKNIYKDKIEQENELITLRIGAFITLGSAFLLFFVFILYPLLLRIEANTRKEEPVVPEIQTTEPQE